MGAWGKAELLRNGLSDHSLLNLLFFKIIWGWAALLAPVVYANGEKLEPDFSCTTVYFLIHRLNSYLHTMTPKLDMYIKHLD